MKGHPKVISKSDEGYADMDWRKSSRCDNSGPYCVEVAVARETEPVLSIGSVALRDSTQPDVALVFGQNAWESFVDSVRANGFDLP